MDFKSFLHPGMLSRAFALILLAIAQRYAVAAGEPPFPGVELSIPNETVPPGGMLQLKVQITEPKPISKGGQKARFNAQFLSQIQGIALFSPSGDASGTAVLSKGAAKVSLNSPLFTMGTNIDYPILTMAMPVKTTATPGQTASLTLDPSFSQWADPNGQPYPVLLKDGSVTVGGSLSILNILPGGGVVRAGTKIAIMGMGFQPNAQVQVNEAILGSQTFVNANEIDITLKADTNMTSRRIRVTNKSTNERATYYSYQRTTAMGKSTHALIAATVPLFAQTTWTQAYFKPVLNSSQFSAVAVENPTAQAVSVRFQLYASNGTLMKTHNVKVAAFKRYSRDLAELFLGVVPATGTTLKVTSNTAIPVLGLLGDDTLGTVDPVDPSPNP